MGVSMLLYDSNVWSSRERIGFRHGDSEIEFPLKK